MFKLFKRKESKSEEELAFDKFIDAAYDIEKEARLKELSRKVQRITETLEPLLNRDTNLDQRLKDIEEDIKRTWDYLKLTKVPTEKPKDTHILIKK